jgi:hypothetical protein
MKTCRQRCSISDDQLVDVGRDHFVNFPPGAALLKEVRKAGFL